MGEASRSVGVALLVVLSAALPPSGAAADAPSLEGRIVTRVEAEEVYRTSDPDLEQRDIEPRVQVNLELHSGMGLSLFTYADFRTYERLEPGEKRAFQDLGIAIKELGLRYRGEGWMLEAGKIHPVFGSAYDTAPGQFGDDYGKQYEIEQLWGAGFGYDLIEGSPLLGDATLYGSLFMTDRSRLAHAAFADRRVASYADGGPANTRWPESFTLAIEGGDGSLTPGLSYNLGLIRRAGGEGDRRDEWGFVAGVTQKVALDADWGLYLMGEIAHFNHFEAGPDDVTFISLGGELSWQGFFASLAGTAKLVEEPGGPGYTDRLITFDAGHEWRIGRTRLSLSAAWQAFEEEGETAEGYGARIRYRVPF